TSIFSHSVYLFLREFSLQDSRGGSLYVSVRYNNGYLLPLGAMYYEPFDIIPPENSHNAKTYHVNISPELIPPFALSFSTYNLF
ncbi:hypothetical protein PO631_27035, partial [Escherichia coli]